MFHSRHDDELQTAYWKVQKGSYRLTPYVERLVPKGRGKPPRVLSIPTVRDRVVLRQLLTALHAAFPDRVARTLPNAHVRQLNAFLQAQGNRGLVVLRRVSKVSAKARAMHQRRTSALIPFPRPDAASLASRRQLARRRGSRGA